MLQVSKSILVVDDDVAILKLVREMLGNFLGAEVTTSPNPQYGFELALKSEFDLLILDLEMPGIQGDTLFHLIGTAYRQNRPEARRVPPLLLMTGHGETPAAQELLREPGVRGLLAKPFDLRRLLDKVEPCLYPPAGG